MTSVAERAAAPRPTASTQASPGRDAPVGIRIERVSKKFEHNVKGEVYAARDVSIDVAPGEFLTLLGPSGCGKTTTLRMIAGFGLPDEGRIAIGGEDVTTLPANARNIGFVFQNYALFPHLSIHENVAYGLEVRKRPAAEIARSVSDVLALVGLSGYERQYPAQLSGGEQQRVALARAIVIHPRVLLFDEPLSNLDARLRIQMRHEIRELQKRLSITTVYVTHDQEEAMAVSDRIAVMNRGSIVQVGSAEDLYYRPASEFVARFIGRVNLVRGRVAAIDGQSAQVDVLGQRVSGSLPARLDIGESVDVVLRPEAIGLDAVAGADGHGQHATITGRTFLGEKLEYLVECAGETLQVARHSTGSGASAMSVGQQVKLALPAVDVALLAVGER